MTTKEKLLARLRSLVQSSYLLVLLGAMVWMVFFDRYNLISQYRMVKQIDQLRQDKAFYEKAILEVDYEYDKLYNNPEELERFAREKYFMKKAGEDVFLVE